jgi:peptide/nickel transport system substrate-binding protein
VARTPAWIATLALIAIAAAGCSKVSTSTSAGAGNPWTHPGVLRMGIREQPDDLNPVLGQEAIDVDLSMLWAGYLVGQDDRGDLMPELAAEVPTLANGGISRDGMTITYHLRPGVLWQDGAPFTADDVIFSWHAVMNPDNPIPSRGGYELIRSITKLGAYDIVVHLSRPYAPFVAAFFSPVAEWGYCVLPQHLLGRLHDIGHAAYNTMPIGTGPFRVVQYEPDNLVRLVANDRYWRGAPGLREIDVRIVGNDNTLATLIKSHEIDFDYRVPHIISRTLSGLDGVTVVRAPFKLYYDIGFNLASPIISDVRVRKALAYATDRSALDAKVEAGADILAQTDQPPFSWAFDPRATRYDFDPDRASLLLDSAGWHLGADGVRWKNGMPLDIGLAGDVGDAASNEAEEVIQAQWRRVGVRVEIKTYPTDILDGPAADGGIELSGKYDTVLENFASGADPDDSSLFECRWIPPAGENFYRICDPALDAAEEDALSHNDFATRKADYDRIQEILEERLPILPLWFSRYDYAVNTDLRNFSPSPAGTPFWNPWAWQI